MATAEIILTLTRDEVNAKIPYSLICEVRYGSRWDTMKRRLRWESEFTAEEREAAEELFKKAHQWHLSKGVPEEVRMSARALSLWLKLGDFCGTI